MLTTTIFNQRKDMSLKNIKKIRKAIGGKLRLSYWIGVFNKNWINPFCTIYINFAFLPFRQAIKLPIWIYGKTKFLLLSGKFIIEAPTVSCGMITIGRTYHSPCASGGGTEIINESEIIFKGRAIIGSGCRIIVFGCGKLIFGENFRTGNQNIIGCSNYVEFGKSINLAHQIQIFDTDFHYMYNWTNKTVKKNYEPVIIGDYSWIGNRTSIMKGTELPAYTIVSSNTLLNRKYDIPKGTVLAGIPAKEIASGYARIRNLKVEDVLYNYFQSGKLVYQFPNTTELKDLVVNPLICNV